MKALYLLLILLSAACCSLSAQEVEKTERIDTLTVNGNVYYYHPEPVGEIYSSKNKIKLEECCGDNPDHSATNTIFKTLVRKIFNTERMRELAKNRYRLIVGAYCNTKGKVIEVDFLLLRNLNVTIEANKHSISIKEIDMLDKELKKHRLLFFNACPDKKYYATSWGFEFGTYLDD